MFQVRKPRNRHLVDIRAVESQPAAQRLSGVLVIAPVAIIAGKVQVYYQRRGQHKSGTDWRDLALLLRHCSCTLRVNRCLPLTAEYVVTLPQPLRPYPFPESAHHRDDALLYALLHKTGEHCRR